MVDFSWDRFDEVQELSAQRYDPHRTLLRPPISNLERFESKEFDHGDVAEVFHENTKISRDLLRRAKRTATELERADYQYVQAAISPDYRQLPAIELPDTDLARGLEPTLEQRRSVRDFREDPLRLEDLAAILQHGCGISERRSVEYEDGAEVQKELRTYPSPGALYPTEVYVCVLAVDGLDPGVYYYRATDHAIKLLEEGGDEFRSNVMDRIDSPGPGTVTAPVVLAFTTAFWRIKSKYGPRGYRYALQETGHLGQNVLLVAEERSVGALPLAAFKDDAFNELLGVDGVNEAITYALVVGYPNEPTDSSSER